MLAVLVKDVPGTILWRHMGAIVMAQLRFALQSIRHAREPAARARLRGQLAVVPMLPRLLRARAEVQRSRCVSTDVLDALLYPA